MTAMHEATGTGSARGKASRVDLTRGKRAALLIACTALGSAIGWLGARIGGNDVWYLAIPACIAFVWLVIADPSQCSRCEERPEEEREKQAR